MIGLKKGIVTLVPYDKTWPREFQKEKKKLKAILGDNLIAIEHCGSTAIPGVSAKPIIDILIGVKTLKKEGGRCARLLGAVYNYYKRHSYSPSIRFLVVKGSESKRTHYVHIIRYKGDIWNRALLFRDYLREHKKDAQTYAKLKTVLSKKHGDDRGVYTEKKTKFIKRILRKTNN